MGVILVKLVPYGLLHPEVNLRIDVVLALDQIQGLDLLVVVLFLEVAARQDRGEGAVREGERHHTYHHDDAAEDAL